MDKKLLKSPHRQCIGKNVKALRERSGLSQPQLAEKMEVSQQLISSIETGNSFPSMELAIKIVGFFGEDLNKLLE